MSEAWLFFWGGGGWRRIIWHWAECVASGRSCTSQGSFRGLVSQRRRYDALLSLGGNGGNGNIRQGAASRIGPHIPFLLADMYP